MRKNVEELVLKRKDLMERYNKSKSALRGDNVQCPLCGEEFIKNRAKVFCNNARSAGKDNHKDAFWNQIKMIDYYLKDIKVSVDKVD